MIRTLKTKPQEQNEAEIDLADQTMQLLGKFHTRSCLQAGADLRSLFACLCDWQDRWATPILNPMTGKPDFEGPLATPRPFDVLIAHKYLVPYDGNTKDAADVVTYEKKRYCYAGKDTWSGLVKAGKISGAEAEPPKLTAFCWLKDFFQLLASAKLTEEEKAEIRPLAACWYYSATECNFDESEEAPIEDASALQLPPGLMNMLMAGAGMQHMLAGADDEDGEEDEDFAPEDDEDEEEDEDDEEEEEKAPKSLYMRLKAKSKAHKEEEEEDDEEEDTAPKSLYMRLKSKSSSGGGAAKPTGGPQKKSKASPSKKVTFSAPEEEEEEEEEEEVGEDDEVDEEDPLARPPETPQAKEIREAILKAVGELNSFIPLPASHMLYFKRMLVRMQEHDPNSQLWFPWGQPPSQHLLKVRESAGKDARLKQYTEDILTLIAPQLLKQ